MVIPTHNNIGKSSTGTQSSQAGTVNSRQQEPAPKSKTDEAVSTKSTSEEVSLSPQAKQMANLEASVQQHTGVDEAKVAAVREAIANGQYQMDSQSISKKMLDMDSLF